MRRAVAAICNCKHSNDLWSEFRVHLTHVKIFFFFFVCGRNCKDVWISRREIKSPCSNRTTNSTPRPRAAARGAGTRSTRKNSSCTGQDTEHLRKLQQAAAIRLSEHQNPDSTTTTADLTRSPINEQQTQMQSVALLINHIGPVGRSIQSRRLGC